MSRARPAGTTPTTRASATSRSTRSPMAPTCSSSTSRPPTRPVTPATSTRRCGPSSAGTPTILTDLVAGLDKLGPWRLLLLPDHATPLRLKTHTTDPVPYLLVDSEVDAAGGIYTEAGVADLTWSPATSSWAASSASADPLGG